MAAKSRVGKQTAAPDRDPTTGQTPVSAVPARLNSLVHGRMRLGILSALAVSQELSFIELKRHLDASDGNLSLHARKLEDANYIECRKVFEKRVPKTIFRITVAGRKALDRYLAHMEALIQATRGNE